MDRTQRSWRSCWSGMDAVTLLAQPRHSCSHLHPALDRCPQTLMHTYDVTHAQTPATGVVLSDRLLCPCAHVNAHVCTVVNIRFPFCTPAQYTTWWLEVCPFPCPDP